MKRALMIVAAAMGGFLITFGAIVLYWLPGFDYNDPERCTGESCALELAAVVGWGAIIGLLIGLSCGFVAYVLTGRRHDDG